MATMTQNPNTIHSHYHDIGVTATCEHGGPYRSTDNAQHTGGRITPTPSSHKVSMSRFNPYGRVAGPATTKKLSNIICGVNTSANLPPYKSPATECLPQIQDPKGLLDTGPSEADAGKAATALILAQAVRSTTHAHQVYLRKQVVEGEVVMQILRQKVEEAEARLQQADLQLGSLQKHLRWQGLEITVPPDTYMNEHDLIQSAFFEAVEEDEDSEGTGEYSDEDDKDDEDNALKGNGKNDH